MENKKENPSNEPSRDLLIRTQEEADLLFRGLELLDDQTTTTTDLKRRLKGVKRFFRNLNRFDIIKQAVAKRNAQTNRRPMD